MSKEKMTATATRTPKGDLEFRYSTGGVGWSSEALASAMAKALKELHRAEKASKPKKRYTVAFGDNTLTGYYAIHDNAHGRIEISPEFEDSEDGKNQAKLLAKALNKQERKRLACNTVTPGTEV